MKKLAVIASGWHYGCQFYQQLAIQNSIKNWEVDLFVISHRHPEHKDTIKEKENIRNQKDENFLSSLDKMLYEYPITKKQIQDLGWIYIEKPNTIGDMEVLDRKSTRLNSSHGYISYAVFCLKKKT